MDSEIYQQLGAAQARIEALDARSKQLEIKMDAMSKQLADIFNLLNQAKGGWKTLAWLAGIASVGSSVAAWFLAKLMLVIPHIKG